MFKGISIIVEAISHIVVLENANQHTTSFGSSRIDSNRGGSKMKKIKFVFVSKDNDFLMSDDDFNSSMKSDSLSVYTEFISDNKIDLPTIYN